MTLTFFCIVTFLFFLLKADSPEEPFRVRYEVMEVPINLPFQKPPAEKPNPKQGIGKLRFSNFQMRHKL